MQQEANYIHRKTKQRNIYTLCLSKFSSRNNIIHFRLRLFAVKCLLFKGVLNFNF